MAPYAPKLVTSSSYDESLKIRENATIAKTLLRKRQNVDFHEVFKESQWLEFFTNLDAKGAKWSVINWSSSFHKFFSKVSFLREWKAVKNSAKHTFVWSTLDVSFWLNHIFQANEYYMEAMRSGLGPGSEVPCMFTACGPPRLKTGKYNVPLGLYSEDTILESGGGNHGIVEYDFLTNRKDSYRIH